MTKISKASVLYFPPEFIGHHDGANCSRCAMFVPETQKMGHCTVVEGSINGPNGICGLFVFGKHKGPDMHGEIPKEVASYAVTGPTHCGSCKFYGGDAEAGPCQIVEGQVEFEGCCNSYERMESSNKSWKI